MSNNIRIRIRPKKKIRSPLSVTGNVEGPDLVKHGKMHNLSVQELVDCVKRDNGCNGGLPDWPRTRTIR